MLKLIKLKENKYTLENLEENIFITKSLKSWKLQILDDTGFNEIKYYKSLKSIQKTISKNMGYIT